MRRRGGGVDSLPSVGKDFYLRGLELTESFKYYDAGVETSSWLRLGVSFGKVSGISGTASTPYLYIKTFPAISTVLPWNSIFAVHSLSLPLVGILCSSFQSQVTRVWMKEFQLQSHILLKAAETGNCQRSIPPCGQQLR